jgi:fibronectin type 3 domain-containing protein
LAITLPGTTQYTDTNVVAGETYFYTLTAFDAANLESLPSTAVSATIPAP